ncbi:hypothetical protein WUBG_09788, partial [Wuchereria bancrofti]
NATIARRHLMTFNENSESESSMDITSSTSTASVTSSLPVSSNQAILAHQT